MICIFTHFLFVTVRDAVVKKKKAIDSMKGKKAKGLNNALYLTLSMLGLMQRTKKGLDTLRVAIKECSES